METAKGRINNNNNAAQGLTTAHPPAFERKRARASGLAAQGSHKRWRRRANVPRAWTCSSTNTRRIKSLHRPRLTSQSLVALGHAFTKAKPIARPKLHSACLVIMASPGRHSACQKQGTPSMQGTEIANNKLAWPCTTVPHGRSHTHRKRRTSGTFTSRMIS